MTDPPICMATWKRPAAEVIIRLAAEAPHVYVWNNGDVDIVPPQKACPNVTVFQSSENIGPQGRFLAALVSKSDLVILWDDDMLPHPGFYEAWSGVDMDGLTVAGQHAYTGKQFISRRPVRSDGGVADYIGTGGMICRTENCAAPLMWRGPDVVKWVAEDALLCRMTVAAGGKLAGFPSLKKTFSWKGQDQHAIFNERFKERLAWWEWVMENV